MNPRTPVLVGVGQVLDRIEALAEAKEPLMLMREAIDLAAADTGCENFLDQVQSVRVVKGIWRYHNPAKWLAAAMGAPAAETVGTLIGGNQNQAVINATASDLLNGDLELAVIAGAENGNALMKARKLGVDLTYTEAPGAYDRVIGADQEAEHHEYEKAKGIQQAIQIYPMYENALRHYNRESLSGHAARVGALWSRFNDVGQSNPHAWVQHNMTAAEITTPSPTNRSISFPYTKFMNANMSVNMGAALIMTTVANARKMGIDEAKWVYPVAGVVGYDHFSASVRDNFYTSPGIRFVGERLLEIAKIDLAQLDYVDLYSCFPSAVQIAAREYGLSEDRDLTVTGGLTFGGGPLNNYVMHSIARTVELLRQSGSYALVTANGGNLYKHVHGLYASEPPSHDFIVDSVQARINSQPPRVCIASHSGRAAIESYTVMYGAEGPTVAHVSCLNDDGERTWVNTQDVDLMQDMTEKEFCGREAQLATSELINLM